MDPYSKYKKELEYYQYFENQKENYVDLTSEQNNSIKMFADILFDKKKNNLSMDLSGLLVDETMQTVDIFCMLIELVLFGISILTNGTTISSVLFSLENSTDDIVSALGSYLRSCGFGILVHEECIEESDPNLFRDRTDYYCQILKKPPKYLCFPGWYVLNYRIIDNKKFRFANITPLEKFKAFFIADNKKIFTFGFKYLS